MTTPIEQENGVIGRHPTGLIPYPVTACKAGLPIVFRLLAGELRPWYPPPSCHRSSAIFSGATS